jgi:cell division control protein 6
LKFKESLDPRVLSSLSEEELVYPPYKALELRDILEERANLAFSESAIEPSVINLCGAFAAREHGDARRALDLLRVAGELAEREGQEKVTDPFVRKAKNVIERNTVFEVVTTLPLQSKLVLYSIYLLEHFDVKQIVTGEVFECYNSICKELDVDRLTQRRVSDLINELDMLGIVNAKVVNLGRYGRTKKITLAVHLAQLANMLDEDSQVGRLRDFIPQLKQQRLNTDIT